MAEAGITRFPDWLVIAQERWDEVERRNQLLVRALGERHPRARFLFAEHPARAQVRQWRWPSLRQVAPNVWTVRPLRPVPDRVSRRLADWIEAMQVRWAAHRVGLDRPFLWTQDPRAATLIERLEFVRLVYDLTDDWPAFEVDPARRAAVQSEVERIGGRADVVFACSRVLEQRARTWRHDVQYLPNAVEPPEEPGAVPVDLDAIPRPRVAYAGTLHSARFDVGLIAGAAQLRTDWSFVLLGPDQLEPQDRDRLAAFSNVHFLGVRPHSVVRSYLAGCEACVVPHVVTEFTQSLDPLKLYEYLAAGRPIVATPVGNAPDLSDYIRVVATADDLVQQLDAAMSEDSEAVRAQRRDVVAGATWQARAEQIENVLGLDAALRTPGLVSVVVVSFNTRALLERALEALRRQEGAELQTIVIDNGSKDGSVELVQDRFPEVELVELGFNIGFAAANNAAFSRCRGEYVLLLNSDAFLEPAAVAELVSAMGRHPTAGAAGPRTLNPDGTLQRSAWPFPTAGRALLEALALHRPLRRLGVVEDLGLWSHDEERSVDFLIGACLLLRAEALDEVGGFDERFWLYGEEADLQRRITDRGWKVVFTPRAVVTHVGGASSNVSTERLRHFHAGHLRFVRKHGGRLARLVSRLALVVGALLRGRFSAARLALTSSDRSSGTAP